jgi:hypothetical protein
MAGEKSLDVCQVLFTSIVQGSFIMMITLRGISTMIEKEGTHINTTSNSSPV